MSWGIDRDRNGEGCAICGLVWGGLAGAAIWALTIWAVVRMHLWRLI